MKSIIMYFYVIQTFTFLWENGVTKKDKLKLIFLKVNTENPCFFLDDFNVVLHPLACYCHHIFASKKILI